MRASRLLLASVTAAVLLGALTTTAAARSISTSSQTWRAAFRELLFEGPFGSARCQITLEGSFHSRSIAKASGSLIGYITRAGQGPCTALTATVLTETLPWHMQYVSFSGTLPTITAINTNIIGWSVRYREAFGITCLGRSTAAKPVRIVYTVSGGRITTARISGTIPTGAECFEQAGSYSSDAAPVTVLNGTAAITVTLI